MSIDKSSDKINIIDVNNVEQENNINEEITFEEKEQMIKTLTYYRNVALTFINTNKKDLASIYLKHTKLENNEPDENKSGVLGINLVEMEERKNIDVAFLPIKILPLDLVNQILEKQKENNEHIIYFLMISPVEEKLIEIDIRSLLS
jgi:hypothetical protein